MKIAFISAAQSIHTVRWVNALASRGHHVRLYSLPNHENTRKEIDPRVTVVYLRRGGFSGYFFNARELRRELRSFQPDIINAHYASGYGTLARRARQHPVMLSVWGSDVYEFPLKSPIHRALVSKNLRKADSVASTSHVMAEQLRQALGYDRPVYITPFGVDCKLFSPHRQEHQGFCIGLVKALEDCYGVNDLIDAFALALERLPAEMDPRLVIYGKGSRRDALQRQIDEMGLSKRVLLCGTVPNTQVPEVMGRMDLFCLPSVSESFGVSAVEAMACCLPVIATDVDGFREVVDDGVTGYLIPARDPRAMADRICELAARPELREEFGSNGRERVLERFDFEKNVSDMEQYYHETAARYARR